MKLSDTQKTVLKRIAKVAWLPLLIIAVLYWWLSPTSWKEEVLLHDGSKIIVDRSVTLGGNHEIGQRPPIKDQQLKFAMPRTGKTIIWEDNYSDDVRSANFLPMLLDVVDGAAYVIASPMGCLSYNKWGRPNPPYVIFKYEANEWKRIPLSELPVGIKTPNLIRSSPDIEAQKLPNPVPAEAISKLVSGYRQAEHRSILREPINSGTPNSCEYMVYDGKGGWRGGGAFHKQPSLEACNKYCADWRIDPASCPCDQLFKKGN